MPHSKPPDEFGIVPPLLCGRRYPRCLPQRHSDKPAIVGSAPQDAIEAGYIRIFTSDPADRLFHFDATISQRIAVQEQQPALGELLFPFVKIRCLVNHGST